MARKANIQDLILIPVILLVLALVLFPLLKVVKVFQADDNLGDNGKQVLANQQYALRGFDSMIVFSFVILLLVVGGMAWMTRSNPLGMAIIIFMGLAILVLSGMLSNLFQTVGGDPVFSESANEFTLTSAMFNKLPLFSSIGIFVRIVLLLGKPQAFGGA